MALIKIAIQYTAMIFYVTTYAPLILNANLFVTSDLTVAIKDQSFILELHLKCFHKSFKLQPQPVRILNRSLQWKKNT